MTQGKKIVPVQELQNLYKQIASSQSNAEILLEHYAAEGYDFANARASIDRILDQNQNLIQVSAPLNLYLHSVFHNAHNCTKIIVANNADINVTSQCTQDNLVLAPVNKVLRTDLPFNDAGDVHWAVLSPHEQALDNLLQLYKDRGETPSFLNQKSAMNMAFSEPPSQRDTCYTPLDLAVLVYVQKHAIYEQLKQRDLQETQMLGKVATALQQSFQKNSNKDMGLTLLLPEKPKREKPSDAAIRTLLDHGAIGSDSAYFPVLKTYAYPFKSITVSPMSLSDYVAVHQTFFAPDLQEALITGQPKTDFDLHIN